MKHLLFVLICFNRSSSHAQIARTAFLEVDAEWVAFQYKFAAANGFILSTQTIDVDTLL